MIQNRVVTLYSRHKKEQVVIAVNLILVANRKKKKLSGQKR